MPVLSGFNVGGVGLQWKSPEIKSSVEDLLRLAQGLHKKKPVVVFFDEFQTQPEVQYIFAGSHQNRLMETFYSQQSPFFKSAALMEVGSLDRDDFIRWLDDGGFITD